MEIITSMVFLLGLVDYTGSQFITVGAPISRSLGKSTYCDNSSKSALVEHFFNIIFSEFHTTPPVCVCVQMCPDQPTYCYPNGCLKRAESSKKSEVTLPVTQFSENSKPVFLLEEKHDFMHDLLNINYGDEKKPASVSVSGTNQANLMPINLRPDPFKDRYKILFKYKKMPKVELKYNLGEQVKNMKSDILRKDHVDVSKTRWPMNKINSNRISHRRMYSDAQDRFFMTFTEKEVVKEPPKYFKRELANTTNNDTNRVYVIEGNTNRKIESDNTSYSLEKIIDSLIESSFDTNKTVDVVTQNNTKYEIEHITETETSNQIYETTEVVTEVSTVKPIITTHSLNNDNDTTNVISINFTNENNDKNKYFETDTTNSTNTFSDMIASLSKRIEIQNNTSLEIMRRVVGNISLNSLSDAIIEQSTLKEDNEVVTTTNSKILPDSSMRTVKKGSQRLDKKLQNSKNSKNKWSHV